MFNYKLNRKYPKINFEFEISKGKIMLLDTEVHIKNKYIYIYITDTHKLTFLNINSKDL